jgi:hypothetical protein
MSDTICLNLIGTLLRAIQADQGTLRGENGLIRKGLGRMAGGIVTHDALSEVLTVLVDRIGNFEAPMDARFGQLGAQLDRREQP